MRKQAFRSVLGLAALATLGLACSSDDDGDSADTTEAAADTTAAPADTTADNPAGGPEFTIEDFTFPEGFTAAAGEEITVTNADGTTHTVTSSDFSVRVSGGTSESLTVDAPGEYAIFCEIHPQMKGTITIE
jgi:plastocyanin